jgi:hypothetical protein
MNDALTVYLFGCVVATFLLVCIRLPIGWLFRWMTKSNVAQRNFRKITARDERGWGVYVFMYIFEIALSWISVATQVFWGMPYNVFRALREMLTPAPEAIRALRFPLYNNPDMSPEAVWAHLYSLHQLNGGNRATVRALLADMNEAKGNAPCFDVEHALVQLAALRHVDAEVIEQTKTAYENKWADEGDFEHLFPSRS